MKHVKIMKRQKKESPKFNYLRRRGVFLNRGCMDTLFLNLMNSWQGIIKKEQETIFEKSIGSQHQLKIPFKDTISACACSF